jgi:histidinol-phosphate aminotransferase
MAACPDRQCGCTVEPRRNAAVSAEELVRHWVKAEIRELGAYHVQDATGVIKLDAMENPYAWPDELRAPWAERLAGLDVNRYPDPQGRGLKARLRHVLGLSDGVELLLGNGSDEIIQTIILALAGPGRSVLSVEPGFVMYRMISLVCGLRYIGVPLRAEDFSLDLPALLQALDEHQPAVVFLACPNNPTGNLFQPEQVRRVIEAAPGLVVVDEAYAPFTSVSFLDDLERYPNLVVMRTLSKMGFAGLRLGYLAGDGAWLDEFDKVRLPYNINTLTQASAGFALEHLDAFDRQTAAIRAERGRLVAALEALPGLQTFATEANFVLVRCPPGRAPDWFEGLKRGGVLIKKLDGGHPLLADCLRITVGTPGENERLLGVLRGLV